jgi:hypothetical protein
MLGAVGVPVDISAGPALLAIPLITLQALVEIAAGGFLALFLTDLTRLVTRGFLVSTGGVLLVIGAIGVGGELTLPTPEHLTDHPLDASWLQPSLRAGGIFIVAFLLYLVAVYMRPALLRVVLGGLALAAGIAAVVLAAYTYPTPGQGPLLTGVSFGLSAVAVGTVTTAMLLGHWYLVVPNLSTKPLLALLGVITGALVGEGVLAAYSVLRIAGAAQVATRQQVVSGDLSLPFWMHVVAGIVLPVVVTGLALQSTRLRSLMSATGLLYVAVLLTLVGQVTGKVIFYSARLPV